MKDMTFEVKATTNDGVEVPVKITVAFPDNQGLVAWNAFQKMAEEGDRMVLNALIELGDTGLIAAMDKAGMVLDPAGDEE